MNLGNLIPYLNQQAQVHILGFGLGSANLAIVLVVDINTLQAKNTN